MKNKRLKDKKSWAKELFLTGEHTQKEIALKVGVTAKTLSKWVNDPDEDWKGLKANRLITKDQQLKYIYAQLNAMHEKINDREKDDRFPTSKEADVISKLSASIKNLEQELSVAQTIDVFVEFLNWLQEVNLEKAQEFMKLQDGFIKYKLAKK